MNRFNFSFYFLSLFLFACNATEEDATDSEASSPEEILMEKVFSAHGELGSYSFVFRENAYSFSFENDRYAYSKTVKNDSTLIQDTLNNDGFYRYDHGLLVNLDQEHIDKYSESLNSVIYFTCLPLNLADPAVNKQLQPEITIKGVEYDVLMVTFDEAGGGKDHEDIFYYWFNKETHLMDYMAYSYNVNGGGVRFRSAYNSRLEGQMRFQDYVNYGAPVGTPLENLPVLFESGELEELSRIEVEQVAASH